MRALAPSADPERFFALLQRHRVSAFAHQALRAAGVTLPHVADALAAQAREVVRQNLVFAAESNRIQKALAGVGLPFLFFKGVSLNILAYGSLGLKQGADIDVLVEPSAYGKACKTLAALGYRCKIPGALSPGELAVWARKAKDTVWWHPERRIVVELHERLAANPQLLASLTARSSRQLVEVASGIVLPTLARNELLAYLCVHGTFSGWYRLKWITDLNALLQNVDAAGLERLLQHATSLGVDRPAACGVLLCRTLFGLSLEPDFEARLRRSFAVRLLIRVALRALVRGEAEEITNRRWGTAPIHVSNLLLCQGIRYKIVDIRQKIGRLILQHSRRHSQVDQT